VYQVEESKLKDKDRGMIKDTVDAIINECQAAVDDNEAQKRARQAAGETLTNAQKSKAVLISFRGVGNINAETVVARDRDLRILFNHLRDLGDDVYEWRLPVENIRPTLNWACHWGPQDDSLLLVGAFLHGFGNWEAIQKDVRLGLGGKFYLDEGKKGEDAANRPIPNAIHLVRRGDFLLGLLREYDEKITTYQNTVLSRQKAGPSSSKMSMSPPPAPAASTSTANGNPLKRRADSEAVNSVDERRTKQKKRRPTPTFTDSEESDEWYVGEYEYDRGMSHTVISPSMDEGSTKDEMRPVKKHLRQLKLSGSDMPRDEKVALLKESLSAIGQRIEQILDEKRQVGEDAERWRRHLWVYVSLLPPPPHQLTRIPRTDSSRSSGRRRSRRRSCRRSTRRWSRRTNPPQQPTLHPLKRDRA
jgi:chromodomain-helicase-DNA-binding protein 1